MDLRRAYNIEDLRDLARRRLPRVMYEYLERGAENEVTLRANRSVFDTLQFASRTLVDVSRRNQQVVLLGRTWESPIGIAPMGAAGLFWHEGEIALARAARSAGVPFVLSTHSFVPLGRLVSEAGGAPWFQLYMPPERDKARALVKRALDAGCEVLVLTTDVPVGGNREYNERNGFGIPLRLGARRMADGLRHPHWLCSVFARAWLSGEQPMRMAEWGTRRDQAAWDDLAWLRDVWPRKLVVKGILGVEDAQLAAEHGVDGIVVSNHGGRQLDGVPSPMEVLAQIAAAVEDRVVVMVDGGFRRGSDVVKALALGARLVFVGRAAMYGCATAGEAGVGRALRILHAEVDRVLALLGCDSIARLGTHYLRTTPRDMAPVLPLPRLRAAS